GDAGVRQGAAGGVGNWHRRAGPATPMTVSLDVRLDGFAEPAGVLVRNEQAALVFAYTPTYLARADALPLSLSLPLTDEPYGDIVTRAFFDNLLQEREGALGEVMAREGLGRDDIAGLLLHLGK